MSDIKTNSIQAWISKIRSTWVSVGLLEIKMLLENPTSIRVIGAPGYFSELLVFKGNVIPILNFETILDQDENKHSDEYSVTGLVTFYNCRTKKAEYGAIKFNSIPENITVTNDMQVKLNQSNSTLKKYSKNVFQYDDEIIHVLNLNKLFNLRI